MLNTKINLQSEHDSELIIYMNLKTNTMKILLCKKKLIFCDGSESFTKGVAYEVITMSTPSPTGTTRVINNQNEPHNLGSWAKHFNLIEIKTKQ